MSFMSWWKQLPSDSLVDVRIPHERHGNSGKPSNSAKTEAKSDFLRFVDINSQPNGRSADSSSATHYFLPKFRTIQTPKKGVANYEERVQQSVVGVFNEYQQEKEQQTISNYCASTWLKSERPKYSIYPHQLDYCDFCAKKEELRRNQTTLNRIRQTGSADEEEQKKMEAEISSINSRLEAHRQSAKKSHDYYLETKKRCTQQWTDIVSLEAKENRSQEESDELERLRHNYTAVLSADYQMQKLVPYWGKSPQPGATYYLKKMSHDIFGIVDHSDNHSTLYIFDERSGPKNTDHTISLLMLYIKNKNRVPPWIKRWHIFLDNTGSTNKNAYFMAWAMEMIQQGIIDYLRISFLIAGHTKFDVDRVFSVTAKAYNASDVFNTQELLHVMCESENISGVVVTGRSIRNWRDKVSEKYTKLPGIRDLHNFLVVKNPTTLNAMMLVRDFCHVGTAKPGTMKLNPEVSAD